MRLTIGLMICLALAIPCRRCNLLTAQDVSPSIETNWRVERKKLDVEYAKKLQQIAAWCRKNGVEQQVEQTLKLYINRDLGRQYIFLPSEKSMPKPQSGVFGQWLARVNQLKKWQAERIFVLAKRAANADAGTAAFQLLNEVLHYNRDHEQVRKILGHRKTRNGWRVAPDRIKIRPATKDSELVPWSAKTYLLATTPNFSIESNASKEELQFLAEKLERWHAIWRQVFFEYWSSPQTVQRWIDGKSSYRHSQKRFRVVFFKNREDYVSLLSQSIRGVEASTGYYSSEHRVSLFYVGEEQTWRHELTHQLFREAVNSGKDPFADQFIWLDEGLATYFESLNDFGSYVTLGGFDARRIQYARIRMFLERLHLPLKEFSQIGVEELQNRADMPQLYSEAAGITDMLMNDRQGGLESRLNEFLTLIYAGRKIKDDTFETVIGNSYEKLDERYAQYLEVESDRFEKYLSLPLSRTEMSLSGADLSDNGFAVLGNCHNLLWIDLSRNTITARRIGKLSRCRQIQQLFLTECGLDTGSLSALRQFSKLDELDLTGSSVSDDQLKELAGLKNLKTLRLGVTRVTDEGLKYLEDLPNLTTLDLSRCEVTDAGIDALKQKLPNLEIKR